MKILVVGNEVSQAEFNLKFGALHSVVFKTSRELTSHQINAANLVFDFEVAPDTEHGNLYRDHPNTPLVVNSVFTTARELVRCFNWPNEVIGFNGFPGFFNRPQLEITFPIDDQSSQKILNQLGTKYQVVKDRVGLVTPRVICMIINEACYTVQEGTARESDIDLAMKLGTNYPAGPFEMLKTIGVDNIYRLLLAIQQDTGDERYKICPLLKSWYLEQ